MYDKNYADNFLKTCEKHRLAEWAGKLRHISKIISMDIEDPILSEVRALYMK